jgi:hypothetical protein
MINEMRPEHFALTASRLQSGGPRESNPPAYVPPAKGVAPRRPGFSVQAPDYLQEEGIHDMKAENGSHFWHPSFLKPAKTGVAIEGLRALEPDINMDEAYQIQLLNIQKRIQAGARSPAKDRADLQGHAGNDEGQPPDFGYLLDTMEVKDTISMQQILQPKVEAEVAFLLRAGSDGRPELPPRMFCWATDCVMASLEIVGSRIAD